MNKQTTVRTVAAKTGRTYLEVQNIFESIIEVWSAELASGGYIKIQDFITLKAHVNETPRNPSKEHETSTKRKEKKYHVYVTTSGSLKRRMSKHMKGNTKAKDLKETNQADKPTSPGKKKIEWK